MGCDANIIGNIEHSINDSQSSHKLCGYIVFQLNDLVILIIYTDID